MKVFMIGKSAGDGSKVVGGQRGRKVGELVKTMTVGELLPMSFGPGDMVSLFFDLMMMMTSFAAFWTLFSGGRERRGRKHLLVVIVAD